MKFLAASAVVLLGLSSAPLRGQQSSDPSYNHVNDNATFGNQKAPKKEKAPTSRLLIGQVTDETGAPLEGALVTLTDLKTKEKTNFFTKKDGRYRFEELDFNKNYQLDAKYKERASESRKLSEFDHTPKPVRILEINTENAPAATASAKAPPR